MRESALPFRLSVAMIVRDAGETIAESIASVRSIADEIVVLDTDSTDDTPAIARRCGARVTHALWTDSFAAARNHCLDHVRGDWVLWLDAGERLDTETAAELRAFVTEQADPAKLYAMYVELPRTLPGGYGERAAEFRLMPRREGLRFMGCVRETLLPAAAALKIETAIAPGRLLRHPRHGERDARLARAARNQRLAMIEATEFGHTSLRALLALGEAAAELGDGAAAIETYREVVRSAAPQSAEMLEGYYGWLAELDAAESRWPERVPVCLAALEAFPLDTSLLLSMGNYLQQQGEITLAERSFRAALQFGQCDPTLPHPTELAEMPALYLSLLLRSQQREDEARAALEEALTQRPSAARLLRALIEIHVQQARATEAIAVAGRLPLGPQETRALRAAIRGACKAVAGEWAAALGYLQTAYVEGCRETLCLRWLTICYLSNGSIEAARPVLNEWETLEPDHPELAAYRAAISQVAAERSMESAAKASGRVLRLDPTGPGDGNREGRPAPSANPQMPLAPDTHFRTPALG